MYSGECNPLSYDLRDSNVLFQPNVSKITYGKKVKYYGAHIWNLLPYHIKNITTIDNLKLLFNAWKGPKCQCLIYNAQLMKTFVNMCKTMYFSEYKSMSFLFRFCMERANSLKGRMFFNFMSTVRFKGDGNIKGSIFMHYTVYG